MSLPAAPRFPDEGTRHAVAAVLRTLADGDDARALVRMFVRGEAVEMNVVEDALGSATHAFVATGLLSVDGSTARSTVLMQTLEGYVFACDRPEFHQAREADFVLGLGPVTRRFAALMPRRKGADVLDLGCGCGVLAVLCAATAASVTAIDINPRATAFTRFNADLNGFPGIATAQGDLFEPVRGRRFDLIQSNAPYIISPASTYRYRDGGPGHCERIAREAPALLRPGGCLMMAANWQEHAGHPWQTQLGPWFEGSGCDAWVLTGEQVAPEAYASLWLTQEYSGSSIPTKELERWVAWYAEAGICMLHGGFVLMSRVDGREPWIEIRLLPPGDGLHGEAFDRVISARDLAARNDDMALLLMHLRPLPGLEAIERRAPGREGWQVERVDLRSADGLRITIRVDPLAAALLGWMDGSRSAADAAVAFAQKQGLPAADIVGALPALLRTLLHAGLLTA